MIKRHFTKKQFDALIRVANREINEEKESPIVFAPCFQTDDDWKQFIVEEEWVKKEYAKYLDEEYAKAEHEYEERIKRDDLDDFIDKIAAEHHNPYIPYKKLPMWYSDLINGRICIVFNAPYEYAVFRAKFSDVLLLPLASDIYAKHPEIAENKWPVVIHSAKKPASQESMTWAIAQSNYRENRTISGLDWFEYDELEVYECARFVKEIRGLLH